MATLGPGNSVVVDKEAVLKLKTPSMILDYIKSKHELYLKEEKSLKNDCSFIVSICYVVVVAVLNSRGTYSPHKGEEEKSLAQKYEDYAKVLEVSYPKSASIMRFISGVYRGDAKIQRSRAEHEYC